jgi:hypothetical protein
MKGIWIRVNGFEKYKGRGDNKHNSWFRCSNRLLEDPDFFEFTHTEILVWIYVLSLVSQKNSDTVFINFTHADRVCRLKPQSVKSALQKLHGKQIVPLEDTCEVLPSNPQGTNEGATIQTDRQNKTKQHSDFDFEGLYLKYPRKEGKSEGLRKLAREIQTRDDFEALGQAIVRYRDHVVKAGTEPKFIKHFSTFVNHWRDWLDPEVGKVDAPSSKFGGKIEDILAEGAS